MQWFVLRRPQWILNYTVHYNTQTEWFVVHTNYRFKQCLKEFHERNIFRKEVLLLNMFFFFWRHLPFFFPLVWPWTEHREVCGWRWHCQGWGAEWQISHSWGKWAVNKSSEGSFSLHIWTKSVLSKTALKVICSIFPVFWAGSCQWFQDFAADLAMLGQL